MDIKDKNSQLFLQLVFMYHAACMEQLGKSEKHHHRQD